ncbi:MAG: ABC transporter ATP-binding protein [Roseibium album]|uniref:Trehalose import ATP-binding protein SugC n=1 Tax=Roseibium album TaxID=311410 RepID=A0A0M6Z5R4_9HYPH|nr:ABC transporter ATP-binding protein [Roseibium album]MBG6142691.1 multiple sugar transport system ATP-binding protein [Labrenzia sp. EL_142]MBG6159338.1 multiple sugar transport system ATP-binding protein [Labrenzia sp. EL_162]MBG6165438.1 multiple sugar transport system ATP-binding protein [Labrenzia sp. EL_195]MBG6177702.1 multiple sugar transport system ATP-binding protein [Labrenzia sp. EL_132]MBG6197574.1 multiple sugar transport system ATP-binding protein [Labrenzia sp. EL_159]MBG620
MTAQLHLKTVNKKYNPGTAHEVHAVQDLDLEVERGEIVALLGSSGCGKTSTLRMIAGFEEVSSGEVDIDGRRIDRLAPAKRGVAMAFEGYSLYPPLTIRENIAFALKSERLRQAEVNTRVEQIAALLEISDILDKHPNAISGGQQQRVSLGRALIRRADLHVLDEPMGQLEPQLRAILRGRIKHYIKEHELTAILVTHDQTEANALADRIAVMEGGLLQQYDTPENLKNRPANIFTGAFIGEPPMNLFAAVAEVVADRVDLRLAPDIALSYPSAAFSEELQQRIQQDQGVMIGIRPHSVQLTEEGLPAEVYANQWLGDQTHIAARFAGGSIVSVVHDLALPKPGDRINLSISAHDLHIFDNNTGDALSHGGQLA